MTFKRRRRRTAAAAIAASLMVNSASVVVGELRGNTSSSAAAAAAAATPTNPIDDVANVERFHRGDDHATTDNEQDESHHQQHHYPPEVHRLLQQSAAQSFAYWIQPSVAARSMPLDPKIGPHHTAYIVGLNGYIEPYIETFERIGRGEDVASEYWDRIVGVDEIVEEGEDHEQRPHVMGGLHHDSNGGGEEEEESLYYKILEEDGIKTTHEKTSSSLRGRGDRMLLLNEGEGGGGSAPLLEPPLPSGGDVTAIHIHLDEIDFFHMNDVDGNGARSLGEDDQEEEYFDSSRQVEEEKRSLQEGLFHHHQKDSEPSPSNEVTDPPPPPLMQQAFDPPPPTSPPPRMQILGRNNKKKNKKKNKNKNKNKDNNNNGGKQGSNNNNKNRKLPKIDRLTPTQGDSITNKQTFSARILPSVVTQSPVDTVSFQLTDHEGKSSNWMSVPKVGNMIYEVTVDGFKKYPNTEWQYAMLAEDENGKRTSTDAIVFKVVGSGGGSGNSRPQPVQPAPSPPRPNPNPSPPSSKPKMPKHHVADSNWPHPNTAIQKATGRIMFEFDNSGQSFVCSGTVVCDGVSGRSIIQTASHCAYNDVLKKFATRAIYVPDQDATRGSKSDFDCKNDRYGCWHLSFAVVWKGWAAGSFPDNVPYDYAYYVVYDSPNTHTGGYTPNLTGTLDKDVPCVPIDFDLNPHDEFVFSIGYSADKDPRLRTCSMHNSKMNGVPWYTNLWLEDCAMTGGASGGPWIHDMDVDGMGSLISVNSWGFTHKPGMAGPVLKTSSGSLAECLFERARVGGDPGRDEGIIVTNC
ncbi:hypothetical protein ACHAXR_012574 [Thalassiosira sp. AJA248-18]